MCAMTALAMERGTGYFLLLLGVWVFLVLWVCDQTVHGQTCTKSTSSDSAGGSGSEQVSSCPVYLEDVNSLLNRSKARNCHRWRLDNATAKHKVTLGVLLPLYLLNSTENKCSNPAPLMGKGLGVQLVEALRFAVEQGLKDRPQVRRLLGAVEIRDSCFSPRFCVEQAVSLAVSSPQAAQYCRGNWSQQAYLTLMDDSDTDGTYSPSCNETDRVPVIIGPGLSSTTKVVAPTLSIFKIPHITYWATSDAFSKKREYPYLFRTVPSDKYQARAMVRLLAKYNWTYVVALSSNDEISGGLGLDAFRHAMADENMCIAFEERFHYSDDIKVEQIVKKLAKERKAQAVMLFAGRRYAETLFAKMETEYTKWCVKERNTTNEFCRDMDSKHFVWIASDGWIADGARYIYKPDSREARMGGNHTLLGFIFKVPSQFWEEANNFSEQVKQRLRNITINNESLKYNPWLGLTSECRQLPCDGTVNVLQDHDVMPPIESGSLWLAVQAALDMIKSAFNCADCSSLSGRFLRAVMQNVTASCSNPDKFCPVFQDGQSEEQDLEPGYLIKNAVWSTMDAISGSGKLRLETVAEWGINKTNDTFGYINDLQPISWAAGAVQEAPESVCAKPCNLGEYKKTNSEDGHRSSRCCWECQECTNNMYSPNGERCVECDPGTRPNTSRTGCELIPPDYIDYDTSAAVAIVTLAAVGMFVVIATAVILHIYRATQVVYTTGQALNNLLLLSLFIGFLSCMVFFNQPSTTWCSVMTLLASAVIIFSTATVLVRTLRLAQTSEDASERHIRCTSCIDVSTFCGQLAFISVMTAIPLLIFVVWVSVDPIETRLHISDTTTVYLQCERKWEYSGIVAFVLVAVIATTAIMAFQTRKLLSDYNEAKLLLFTAFALCVLWIALTPTFFVTDRVLEPVIIALTILAHMLAIWFCLFLPRLYIIILRPLRNPVVVPSPREEQNKRSRVFSVFSSKSSQKEMESNGSMKAGNGQVKAGTPSSSPSSDSMILENHADGRLTLKKETSL